MAAQGPPGAVTLELASPKKQGRKKGKRKCPSRKTATVPPEATNECEYEYVDKHDIYRYPSELVIEYGLGSNNEGECVTLAHAVYQHRIKYGHLAANGLVDPDLKYVPYLYAPENVQQIKQCRELQDDPEPDGENIGMPPDTAPKILPECEGVPQLDPRVRATLEREKLRYQLLETRILKQIADIDQEIASVHLELARELGSPDSPK